MNRRFDRRPCAATAAVCAILLLLSQFSSRCLGAQLLSGHVPKVVQGLRPLRHYDAANRLTLAIGLPLRDAAGLDTFLRNAYDPSSPGYHQFLTPSEFADRFGPTSDDYEALKRFARSHNLVITGTHPNRTLLDVAGSVADIETAFNVSMQVYQHPAEKRTFIAPDREPSVDASVPILHIAGLDNYFTPHPNYVAHPIRPLPSNTPALGSGAGGTYLGFDFRDAYVPSVNLDGTGQSVGLLEFDSYFTNDPVLYEQQAGLPHVKLTNVLIDGFTGLTPGGGNGEVCLDIEMAAAMAPGLSNILVYEATNSGFINVNDDMLNKMATDDLANQLSASWTYGIDSLTEQIYKQMAAQGQSFFNASGDSGAYPPGEVPTPCDDTNITIVGGTTLFTTGPGGQWQSEAVWSWFNQGIGFSAGSGGVSANYALPPWQQGISMVKNKGSTTFRNLPDVALTADNIFVIADNGQAEDVGGTSAATPLWAAFVALANEQGASKGRSPVGFINPTIYALGKGPLYTTAFHDIMTGNNTNFVSPLNYQAVIGYDLCTGWGSPTGSNMLDYLAPIASAPIIAVSGTAISGGNGNGIIDNDECNNFTVVLTNEGNATATRIQSVLSSLTPGVIIAQASSTFPDLAPRQAGASQTTFTLSSVAGFVCGTPVNLQLVVKCAQVIQTNSITLTSGLLGAPVTFSSTGPVGIPVNNPNGVNSPITVSGLDAVGKITVSTFISSTFVGGLVLQLTAPNGQSVLLSQLNGGQGQNYGVNCNPSGQTIFDDDAELPVTLGVAPFVGTFQPQEALSSFDLLSGTNLNGTWTLNVSDIFPGNVAELSCWSLNITPEICVDGGGECPGSDLSLSMTALPDPVLVGNNLVFTLLASNAGPSAADNVVISQTLPPGFAFLTTSNYPVAVTQLGSTIDLSLGSMPVFSSAQIAVVTVPNVPGLATSVATISSPAADSNPNNNSASATANVRLPGADLAVSMLANPKFVLQGASLTYTITVTNNGPFAATLVTLNNVLPPNANLLSATTSQGNISSDGTVATIGTLNPGSNALVTIIVSPTTTGNLTASSSASLSQLEVDPNLFNNSASATVTVGPSADLGVSGGFSPPTILSGAKYTNIAIVVNNGPSAATGVAFSQTIPVGATFLSSSASGVVVANGVINWDVGAMSNGATLAITNIFQAPTLLSGIPSESLSSTLSVFGQPGDAFTNNDVATLQALVEPPTITITPVNAVLLSGSSNGAIAPGDAVQVQFNLQNTGNINTTNVIATLLATGGVTLPSPSFSSYGQLAAGAPPVGRVFSFTANSTNGGTVVASLQLTDGSASLGTVAFTFYMPVVTTFWNSGPIDIPNKIYVPDPDSGPANPYPSQLAVSNVTGFVSDVSITLSNMSHAYPNDIAMLLVAPGGQNIALMVDTAAHALVGMVDQTLIFDQDAPNSLPASGQIVSGTYRPADYLPSYSLSNAPAAPYTTNLAVLSGLSPNGTWSLYAYDTTNGDSGGISNGWAVTVTTITPVNQESDLAANLVASTAQATIGDQVTLVLSVTNNGPNATAAYLTNVLPAGLQFVSTSAAQTNYTQNGRTTLYNLGVLSPSTGVSITNLVTATAGGVQSDTIVADSTLPDPNLANNSASASISVTFPFGDMAAGISATPDPVVVSSNLTYTLLVTNLGPGDGLNVSGSFSLNGLNFISAAPSQGTAILSGGAVLCDFGSVPAGNIATVVVTASPQGVGILTNVWSVATSDQDTNPANNSVSAIVTVINPSPNIVAAASALLAQGAGFSNGAVNASETVTVALSLSNSGSASTANLVAALQANANLTPVTASQTYGAIPPGGLATEPYTFTAQGIPGAAVTATLNLTDGASSLGSVSFVFLIPAVANYSQPAQIIIPEFGPGTPYPSQIQVSGLPGLVDGVRVTLNGFTHTFPHDVNLLLADPAGQELYLMSHVGGAFSVSNLTLTFADSATQSLPLTLLSSGAYLPTAYDPLNPLPNLAVAPLSSSLSVFDGTDPNGNWSLYVYDDTQGNSGAIAGGWAIALTSVSTVNPAARLEAGMVHAPEIIFGGDFLNYLVTVTNLGPGEADNVVLSDTLPSSVNFVSATLSQGAAATANGVVTCNFGVIPSGATATANIRVLTGAAGSIVNTATVTTSSTDLYLADSTVANTSTVTKPTISFLEATNFPSGLQLTLLGQSSQTYGIQVSSDLLNWTTLSTNTAGANGTFIFTDSGSHLTARFYRAIRLAQ